MDPDRANPLVLAVRIVLQKPGKGKACLRDLILAGTWSSPMSLPPAKSLTSACLCQERYAISGFLPL
jgi:hypothetical protein